MRFDFTNQILGVKKLTIGEETFDYSGMLDSKGNAFGFGTATSAKFDYSGTWRDNKYHGFCEYNFLD